MVNPEMYSIKLNHRRRRSSCVGWYCLTDAEQFGIVFSSAVVFLVLLIAYAYYTGRGIIRRRSRQLVHLPGGRTAPRRSAIMMHRPTFPIELRQPPRYMPYQNPSMMPQPLCWYATPQPSPYAYSHAARLVPGISQTIHGLQSPVISQAAPGGLAAYPYAAVNATGGERGSVSMPRHEGVPFQENMYHKPEYTGWRYRLARLIGMAVGRASTITSSSEADDARIGSSQSHRRESSRQTTHRSPGMRHPARSQSQVPQSRQPVRRELDTNDGESTCSSRTDAATVHSDDFDRPRGCSI